MKWLRGLGLLTVKKRKLRGDLTNASLIGDMKGSQTLLMGVQCQDEGK